MTREETSIKVAIVIWLNEGDSLRGWGAYEMNDGLYITYDHPYPQCREYWRLSNDND